MARVRPVQHERCELADEMVGRLPHLDMAIVCDSDELPIRREFDGVDGLFEVEMVEHRPSAEVGEQRAPVFVDGDEDV